MSATGDFKRVKSSSQYNMYNMLCWQNTLAVRRATKLLNVGKSLRALNTTFIWKLLKGTRLIIVPKGNNFKDWVIRR